MNYLAHFFLAGPSSELIAGALAGDFVKGPLRGDMPSGIEKGIMLHRRTDALVDQSPAIKAFRARLPASWRRFAGPVLDLLFDQQLGLKWARFHHLTLKEFSDRVDCALQLHLDCFTPRCRQFAQHVISSDLLCSYRLESTLAAAVQSIAQRSRHGEHIHRAYSGLKRYRESVAFLFDQVFPEMLAEAIDIRESLTGGSDEDASSKSSFD